MFTATLCLLQDLIEAAEDASSALERDIPDLDHANPAIYAVRHVQQLYSDLILVQQEAILELRKLTPETLCEVPPGTEKAKEPHPR